MTQIENNQALGADLNTQWQPVATSGEAALSSTISGDEFQSQLAAMQEEFSTMAPNVVDFNERPYVSLHRRNQLLEKHFPFGMLHIRYQFTNLQSDAPICYATLYVLTDDGYLPWFSRMGMGVSSESSSDGMYADAETSARRRILIALGLGSEGQQELEEISKANSEQAVKSYMDGHGLDLRSLLGKYNAEHTRFQLPPLSRKIDAKDDVNWRMLPESDRDNVFAYTTKKQAS